MTSTSQECVATICHTEARARVSVRTPDAGARTHVWGAAAHVPVKTPMTERSSKHSAQIKIDLFPQMRAGWRGSWGKMGGQAMKAGEIALAGPHT
eukprot:COSAG02_NODE_429_length_22473_cov_38.587691_9_plen_94_part_01